MDPITPPPTQSSPQADPSAVADALKNPNLSSLDPSSASSTPADTRNPGESISDFTARLDTGSSSATPSTPYAFTSEQDFTSKTGLKDMSSVQELQPGQTPTSQYYKFAGNPTVYSQNQPGGSGAPVGTSDAERAAQQQKDIQTLKDQLTGGNTAPSLYSAVDEYNKLRSDQGVAADETSLNAINTQISQAQEELNQFKQTNSAGMPEGGYLGSISEAERNMNFRLDSLNLQAKTISDRINTKNTYINTMVNLGEQDYNTAYKEYTDAYNQNYQAVQLYNSEQSQQKQDAMTGFTTIANLLKDKNITTLDPAVSQQLDTLALQAGLPQGLFQSVIAATPDEKILSPVTVDNGDGSKSIYFYTQSADGTPHLKSVQSVGSSGDGSDTGYIPGLNPTIDAYVAAVQNGNATMAQVPAGSIRNQVAIALNQGTQGTSIVNSQTDTAVKAIIAANPGEYGHAADAIDATFGKGTATKYDAQLKAVYNNGQSVGEAFNSNTIYSPLAASRFTTAANKIVSNFIDLPAYQLTAGGQLYLGRIQAALKTPGSVSDQDLLDSLTKLNTGGNAISDAQVRVVTDGKSFSDWASTLSNKLGTGGVLSDAQRNQISQLAQNIFAGYQKAYQPIYDQVTKQLQDAGIPKAFWTIPDLNALSSAAGQSGGGGSSAPANTTHMQGPDGQEYYVPNANVQDFIKAGGKTLSFDSAGNASASKPTIDLAVASKGIINGYNIKSYATDPNHEKAIAQIYQSIPPFAANQSVTLDQYIQSKARGSQVKGQDIIDAAKSFNVDPYLVVALMQQDSSFGTKGKAISTRNPGNVGNTDDGSAQAYKTWRDGVFAVAQNLSKRRIASTSKTI